MRRCRGIPEGGISCRAYDTSATRLREPVMWPYLVPCPTPHLLSAGDMPAPPHRMCRTRLDLRAVWLLPS